MCLNRTRFRPARNSVFAFLGPVRRAEQRRRGIRELGVVVCTREYRSGGVVDGWETNSARVEALLGDLLALYFLLPAAVFTRLYRLVFARRGRTRIIGGGRLSRPNEGGESWEEGESIRARRNRIEKDEEGEIMEDDPIGRSDDRTREASLWQWGLVKEPS